MGIPGAKSEAGSRDDGHPVTDLACRVQGALGDLHLLALIGGMPRW
ncbi:hypothetical protein QFZ32_000662 [Streptomyces canus]|uniref:Uncharacterized protein n=1 Tax=Streptomyces canus TaxID=58343 RepID=A0AAW8F4P7_9ACTN|nr:hypothetical protein [Streptomyces canus]MDQ1065223.1 hypothetical protein [Streptomyces canus]